MSGVYNRKLFRQSGARDELRKMGGIMSSSEELMREALMTAMQAPRPADLGPMSMPQQPMGMPAPPVMQPQQPMMQPQRPMDMGMGMQQPMPQQPMDMGMQQPMDDGMGMMQPQSMMPQQPIQPAIAEPAYMPPQMPQSLQMQPAQPPGFFLGGLINLAPTMGSAEASEDPAAPPAPAARPNPACRYRGDRWYCRCAAKGECNWRGRVCGTDWSETRHGSAGRGCRRDRENSGRRTHG
jgi:hypothetical protein